MYIGININGLHLYALDNYYFPKIIIYYANYIKFVCVEQLTLVENYKVFISQCKLN